MNYKNLTKTKLVELCKKKNLAISGNKSDLIKRLENVVDVIEIKKDKNNNYVHESTGFIFDKITKRVIMNSNHEPLKRRDIEICKELKFLYILPETLDGESSIASYSFHESSEDEEEEIDDEDCS